MYLQPFGCYVLSSLVVMSYAVDDHLKLLLRVCLFAELLLRWSKRPHLFPYSHVFDLTLASSLLLVLNSWFE